MYAVVCIRPDISQAAGVVSRYMHNLGKRHLQVMKRIRRYLLKTVNVGLIFGWDKTFGQCLVRYVGSNYASDLD